MKMTRRQVDRKQEGVAKRGDEIERVLREGAESGCRNLGSKSTAMRKGKQED